jgi:P27 family predicted phage terminase small subunit
MAGRKPKPTALKLLGGNAGKRKPPAREPKPTKGVPPCPAHLSPRAKAAWKRVGPELERMGVLTVADGMALELLVAAYAEYRDARETVAREGATYESLTQNGMMIRAHPSVAIASDAWRRVRAMLAEFGLTPSARTRVQGAPGEETADPFEELLGGGGGRA